MFLPLGPGEVRQYARIAKEVGVVVFVGVNSIDVINPLK